MTNRPTLEDEQIIDRFLHDADMPDAGELRDLLLGLRTMAGGPPPMPSAEVAALMAPAAVSLAARRQRRHRRMAIAAIMVAASVGAGTAAVAATDQGFRDKAQETITVLINAVTNGPPAPAPGRPSPGPLVPVPTPVPGQGAGPSAPVKGPPEPTGQEVPAWLRPETPPATLPGNPGPENTARQQPSEHQNRGTDPRQASVPSARHG